MELTHPFVKSWNPGVAGDRQEDFRTVGDGRAMAQIQSAVPITASETIDLTDPDPGGNPEAEIERRERRHPVTGAATTVGATAADIRRHRLDPLHADGDGAPSRRQKFSVTDNGRRGRHASLAHQLGQRFQDE